MDLSDRQLLEKYLSEGKESAFEELVARHKDMVFAVCMRILGDAYLAEDAAQLVFVRLLEKAEGMDEEVGIASWLFNTARNVAMTMARSERRRRIHEEKYGQRESLRMRVEEERRKMLEELWPYVEEAVAELPSRLKDAVLMYYMEGKNFKEVGKMQGCSEDAARKRVNRGLELIRSSLARAGVSVGSAMLVAVLQGKDVKAAVPPDLHKGILARCRSVRPGAGGTRVASSTSLHSIAWIAGVVVAVGLGVGAVLWGLSGGKAPVSGKDVAAASGEVVGGVVGVGECTLVRGDVRRAVRLRDEVKAGDMVEVKKGVLVVKGDKGGFVAAAEGSRVKVLGEGTGGGLSVQLLAGRVEVEGKVDLVGSSSGNVKVSGSTRRMWEERGGRLVDVTGRYPTMLFLRDYRVVDLGTIGGMPVVAYDMNDAGVVVGGCGEGRRERAFIWMDGRMELLKGLEKVRSRAVLIDDGGRIVSYRWHGKKRRMVVYSGGACLRGREERENLWWVGRKERVWVGAIGVIGREVVMVGEKLWRGKRVPIVRYRWSGREEQLKLSEFIGGVAVDVNRDGVIVGRCLDSKGRSHACVWRGGVLYDLSNRFRARNSAAMGISSVGDVVGSYADSNGLWRPFLYKDGIFWDVSSVIDPVVDVMLVGCRRIASNGYVLCNGLFKGKHRAFLLVPKGLSERRKEVSHEV